MDAVKVYVRKNCFHLLFLACAASWLLQTITIAVFPGDSIFSNLLVGFMGLFAITGCVCAAYRAADAARLWILLGIGFLLSTFGQLSSTWYEFVNQTHVQSTAINSDFLYFAYGIPILLAVCSGGDEKGLRSLFWLDMAQATIAGTLTFVQIFSALPAFGGRIPISAGDLMGLYNFENALLAIAVSIRLLSNPRPIKKRFYQDLAVYLWLYAFIALIVGYLELDRGIPDGIQDIAWGFPFLVLLALLAFRGDIAPATRHLGKTRQTLALLIDNLSPILFTLAIVLMGVRVAVVHRLIAFVCIATAVVLYGIRAALLHGKYAQAQDELTKTATALLEANDRLLALSIRDSLTGIYNRRHFDEALLQEWNRSRRLRQPLSLLIIDVDHFKALNDQCGHQAGDECLRIIASEIAGHLRRPDDLVARYGGEEFAVILPGADRHGAFLVAETIRSAIERTCLLSEYRYGDCPVTVSIGIATETNFLNLDPAGLIRRADMALYAAKNSGRNQSRNEEAAAILPHFDQPSPQAHRV